MPSHNDLGEYGLKKLKKKYSNDLLDDLMMDLQFLIDSGYYDTLFKVYTDWKEPVSLLSDISNKIAEKNNFLVFAHENLRNIPVKFLSDLIDYDTFYFFFPFLEWVYSMYLERQLEPEDVERLFSSGVGEKIALNLLNFAKFDKTPEVTSEFFQKLQKLKWKNRKTKKIYTELDKIISLFLFKDYGINESSFNIRQARVILFLAGCSALKEGKEKVDEGDVFTAYKTLFKIIKTDFSELIDGTTSKQRRMSHGYLVCEICGDYYKLQSGEKPEDFSDICECGGKFKYMKSLDKSG
jgi:hypothetical protein